MRTIISRSCKPWYSLWLILIKFNEGFCVLIFHRWAGVNSVYCADHLIVIWSGLEKGKENRGRIDGG